LQKSAKESNNNTFFNAFSRAGRTPRMKNATET